jgi:hypothetical protein
MLIKVCRFYKIKITYNFRCCFTSSAAATCVNDNPHNRMTIDQSLFTSSEAGVDPDAEPIVLAQEVPHA